MNNRPYGDGTAWRTSAGKKLKDQSLPFLLPYESMKHYIVFNPRKKITDIANKTCVLQIAPVCMTENLGTRNLTLFSMEKSLCVQGFSLCNLVMYPEFNLTAGCFTYGL